MSIKFEESIRLHKVLEEELENEDHARLIRRSVVEGVITTEDDFINKVQKDLESGYILQLLSDLSWGNDKYNVLPCVILNTGAVYFYGEERANRVVSLIELHTEYATDRFVDFVMHKADEMAKKAFLSYYFGEESVYKFKLLESRQSGYTTYGIDWWTLR